MTSYTERPAARPDVVLWQSAPSPHASLILPDGCLDLLWDGEHLSVAGPDTIAHLHVPNGEKGFTGLRFAAATGPAALGLSAHEVVDQRVPLDSIWNSRRTALLEEQVARNGASALEQWLLGAPSPDSALGRRLFGMARAGLPVAEMAEQAGLSARQLQRRSRELFGYGAAHLTRVLRLQQALSRARSGHPLAEVAARTGYCDQAHLSREARALTGRTPLQLLA